MIKKENNPIKKLILETNLIFDESALGENEKADKIAFLLLRYQKEKILGVDKALNIQHDLPKEKQFCYSVAHERATIINSLKDEAAKLKYLFDNSGKKSAAILAPEASMKLANGNRYVEIKKKHTTHFTLSAFVVNEVEESKKTTAKEAMIICWRSFPLTDPYRCDIIEDVLRNPYIDAKGKIEEIKPILPNSGQCKSKFDFMKRIKAIELEVIGRIIDASEKDLKVVIEDMINACIRESAFDYCVSAMTHGEGNDEIIESMKQYIETIDKDKRISCLIELVNSLMNSDKISSKDLNNGEKVLKQIAIKLISEQLCNRLLALRKEKPSEYTQEAAIYKALGEILPSIWGECKLLFIEDGLRQMKLCALVDDAISLYKKWMNRKMKEEERNTIFQYIVCDAYKDFFIKKEEMKWIVETCLKDEPPNLIYYFNSFYDIIASNKSSDSLALVSVLEKLEVEYKFSGITNWFATLKTKKDVKKSKEDLNSLIVSIYDKCTDIEIKRDEQKIKALLKDLSMDWKIYAEYLFLALKLRFLLKHPFGQIKVDNAKIDKFLKEFDKTSINKKPLDRTMILEILLQIAGSDYEKLKKEFTTRWADAFCNISKQDNYEIKDVSVNVQGDSMTFAMISSAAEISDNSEEEKSPVGINQKKVLKDSLMHENAAFKSNQSLNSIATTKTYREADEYEQPKIADTQYIPYSIAVGKKDEAEKMINSYDSFIETVKAGRQLVTFENNVFDLERLKASNEENYKMLISYIGRDIGNLAYSGGKIKDIPSGAKCGEIVDPLSLSLFAFTPDATKVGKNRWKMANYDGLSDFFIKISLELPDIKEMLAPQLNIKDFGKYVTLRRSTDQKEMNFVLLSCMQGHIDENYFKLAQDVLDDTKGEGPLLMKEAASRKKVTFIANAKEEFSKWLLFYADPEIDTLSIKGPFVKT